MWSGQKNGSKQQRTNDYRIFFLISKWNPANVWKEIWMKKSMCGISMNQARICMFWNVDKAEIPSTCDLHVISIAHTRDTILMKQTDTMGLINRKCLAKSKWNLWSLAFGISMYVMCSASQIVWMNQYKWNFDGWPCPFEGWKIANAFISTDDIKYFYLVYTKHGNMETKHSHIKHHIEL